MKIFTNRFGGSSSGRYDSLNLATHVGDNPANVRKNREILAKKISITQNKLFFMNQVHGNSVSVIDHESSSDFTPTADALVTTLRGVALVVLVADCVPVLLASPTAIAAIHIGRAGLLSGVLEETLKVMHALGSRSGDIKADIGPAICGGCYEVSPQMYQDVVSIKPATSTNEKVHCLDLIAGVRSDLKKAGISESDQDMQCTAHQSEYFSYRRDGVTGRQAGVISW